MKKPEIVTRKTKEHWEDNDIYQLFITECLQPSIIPDSVTSEYPKGKINNERIISLTALYGEFKNWFDGTFPKDKIPLRPTVQYQMDQRLGTVVRGKGWPGWQLNRKGLVIGERR